MTKAEYMMNKIASPTGRDWLKAMITRAEGYGIGPDARKWARRAEISPVIRNTLDMPASAIKSQMQNLPGGDLAERALDQFGKIFPNQKRTSPEVVKYIKSNVESGKSFIGDTVKAIIKENFPTKNIPLSQKRKILTAIQRIGFHE